MPELDLELRALASHVELPAERDLVPAVRARLASAPRRRPRMIVVLGALAVVAAAVGIAFAVPPARSAILRFLGLESVTIVRVDRLPPVAPGPAAAGRRVSFREAEQRTGFHALLPDLGSPDAIYVDFSDQLLVLLYGAPRPGLRVSEVRRELSVFAKMATTEQHVEPVRVGRFPGVWIRGIHVVSELYGQPRLSGNALIWERDGLALRVEGKITKAEALRIARSFHPR